MSKPTERPRRGWREPIERGIWRIHTTACPSSSDHKPKRRCECPHQFKAPGTAPGTNRTVTVHGSLMDARREKATAQTAGRPAPAQPVSEPKTLHAFAHYYLQARAHDLAPLTIETTSRDYAKWVHPYLGNYLLDEITRPVVKAWLADTIRRATSRRAYVGARAALSVILSYAVEEDRIPANPALGLRLPRRDPTERRAVERVLTHDELDQLCAYGAVSRAHDALLRVAGEAGLRRGEAIALRWPNVHFDERRIRVRESAEQIGTDKRIKNTKSGRDRAVAIKEETVTLLGAWYQESVIEGGADANGLVWPGRKNKPMSQGTPGQILRRALVRAGLVDNEGKPLVSFHGLRHTAASIMFSEGVATSTIAAQLGHADSGVTTTVYEHLVHDSHLDAAANAFNRSTSAQTSRGTVRGKGAG
jgi:integrase